MRRKQSAVLTALALMLVLGAGSVLAVTGSVTVRVNGMTCGGCATSVERALKSTEGVTDVRISYEKGKAVIKVRRPKGDGR